ncbi:MAG TPA: insulinase family protein, partial [Phycisphaerales bacterium]|nr:insulinase family protein [Phycisphaerales bacterium]
MSLARRVAVMAALLAWPALAGGMAPGTGASQGTLGQPDPNAPGRAAPEPAAPDAPLPTDPRLVTGRLENGLAYVVLRHANPPNRAAVWMHVSTGSLNEREEERGLAHYLEHMAFNGSEHFPPGEVVKFFESLGLVFGQHQNAFTSLDQTTYMLFLPDAEGATLAKGLLFFGDVAGRLLLEPGEVEQERNVILEERRSRLEGAQRVQEYILERLAPGSLLSQRLPIGTEESIKGLTAEALRGYYRRYYTPSNITLIVVADMEPGVVVEEIRRAFAGAPGEPRPADQDARVGPSAGARGIVAADPELTEAEVTVARLVGPRPPTRTEGRFREDLVDSVATAAFNRRMVRLIGRGETPFLSASAAATDLFGAARLVQASAGGAPERWREMLARLGLELARARRHGFTARELEDVSEDVLAASRNFVRQEPTVPARLLLQRLNQAVATDEPILSAAQELDLLERLLPTITAEEISRRFAELYSGPGVIYIAALPSSAPGLPTEAELVELGEAAVAAEAEALAEGERPGALLETPPEGGEVLERAEHAATEVGSAWLSSGARLHHRFMPARRDQASATITLAWGALLEDAGHRGLSEAAAVAFERPATARLTSDDVRDLLIGKNVSVSGSAGMDAVTLTASGAPDDLETGLQLAHLLLTEPKLEAAALDHWKERQRQQIAARDKDPQAAFSALVPETIFPAGDPRLRPLTLEQVEAVTLEAAQAWLTRMVREAPLEVAIVGDVERGRAEELARRYLATLPARARIGPGTHDERRRVARPAGPLERSAVLATQTPAAVVLAGFFASDAANLPDTRALEMAARVLTTRMTAELR